jgi:hypothetical protein
MSDEDDLLTPDQAERELLGRVSAQVIRIRVRRGQLTVYKKKSTPRKVFVKRSDVLELFPSFQDQRTIIPRKLVPKVNEFCQKHNVGLHQFVEESLKLGLAMYGKKKKSRLSKSGSSR